MSAKNWLVGSNPTAEVYGEELFIMSKCNLCCFSFQCKNYSNEEKECKSFKLISRADVTVYRLYGSLWSEYYECEQCHWRVRFIPSHYKKCISCGKRIIYNEKEYQQYVDES